MYATHVVNHSGAPDKDTLSDEEDDGGTVFNEDESDDDDDVEVDPTDRRIPVAAVLGVSNPKWFSDSELGRCAATKESNAGLLLPAETPAPVMLLPMLPVGRASRLVAPPNWVPGVASTSTPGKAR